MARLGDDNREKVTKRAGVRVISCQRDGTTHFRTMEARSARQSRKEARPAARSARSRGIMRR